MTKWSHSVVPGRHQMVNKAVQEFKESRQENISINMDKEDSHIIIIKLVKIKHSSIINKKI